MYYSLNKSEQFASYRHDITKVRTCEASVFHKRCISDLLVLLLSFALELIHFLWLEKSLGCSVKGAVHAIAGNVQFSRKVDASSE